MFFLTYIRTIIPLEPKNLRPDKSINEIILDLARKRLEGKTIEPIGQIIAVLDIDIESMGEIKPRNPNVFYKVLMKALVFKPVNGEVLIGRVEDVTESSVFINIGSIDAMLPVNQITNDKFRFFAKRKELRGARSKIVIKKGDWIRARVYRYHFRAVTEVLPLTRRGTTIRGARKIVPKTEISVIVRSKENGLGPEKILERIRKEIRV